MVTLEKIQQALETIRESIIRTPLVHSPTLSSLTGGDIYLKLENLQRTGSFKIRGATYKISKCRDIIQNETPNGIVAASAGNHAQGVALAASRAGIPATIIMPEGASISKQEATRAYGGKVILEGKNVDQSLEKAKELSDTGMTFIHPFDDPDIIAGQGTIALEILEDMNDIDTIIIPIGGGGLISGVAVAAKSINPGIRIIGVQAALCPSAYVSYHKGIITKIDAHQSIADGISVKQTGTINFDIIRKYVDEIVLAGEEDIAGAILLLLERKKILAEGAGAAPLGALLNGTLKIKAGSKVVLLISGGNVDSPLLGRILSKGLLKTGRITRIRVRLDDIPGTLSGLLSRIANLKANVLHIYHDRNVKDIPVTVSCVEIELETRGFDHIDTVRRDLESAGYHMEFK